MPLQPLNFKPGIYRDNTSLANEGGWFECDKVRFRSGYPEKIGGWTNDGGVQESGLTPTEANAYLPSKAPAGSFWGVCRSFWNWISNAGRTYLSLGTHRKLYIQDSPGGALNDVTPLRNTTTGTASFSSTFSNQLTVTEVSHGAVAEDFVTFSGATSLGGNITDSVLNQEHVITSVVDIDTYVVTLPVYRTAADTGNGGAGITAAYQINNGNAVSSYAYGFGTGGFGGVTSGSYSNTGWGFSSTAGIVSTARIWSQANYGDYLLAAYRGGPMYMWVPSASITTFYRAQQLSSSNLNTQDGTAYWTTDANCPSVCNIVFVSDSSRFVFAFGCNDYGSASLNPLLIRWSDQEDYSTWTPAVTNQAGSLTLSAGSEIVAVTSQRQEILVFTDTTLYSLQYLGPPYVWGVQQLGVNISIISQNAVVTTNNTTFWMGVDKFYMYDGRLQTLPCTVWQHVFNNIDPLHNPDTFSGSNEGFNEVWWFYTSRTASYSLADSYVVYNYVENIWYYGTMSRTAWFDTSLRTKPIAAGTTRTPGISAQYANGFLYNHEDTMDDGSTNPASPIEAYIQSSDFDIGDGHNYGFVWRLIPDVNFNGTIIYSTATAPPEVTITLLPRQNPGAPYGTVQGENVTSVNSYQSRREYSVQQFTEIVYTRVRGREMSFKISSSTLGTAWQLGVPRMDIRPDGRR